MRTRLRVFAAFVLVAATSALPQVTSAQQGSDRETKLASANDPAPSAPAASAAGTRASAPAALARSAAEKQEDEDALRLEGEKRFRANCGRCHQAPHKLSPRMMATAIRHMRVRATITDEDMRVILHYMTQ
jgi:mono/diheme cytochrome c family protein